MDGDERWNPNALPLITGLNPSEGWRFTGTVSSAPPLQMPWIEEANEKACLQNRCLGRILPKTGLMLIAA
jgi:hypothetical protein